VLAGKIKSAEIQGFVEDSPLRGPEKKTNPRSGPTTNACFGHQGTWFRSENLCRRVVVNSEKTGLENRQSSILEALKIDERMPLIWSDAAYKPEPLMCWATLQDVRIDGDRTMVKFENVKKIRGHSVALRFTFCN
jgi:hypothetical protein